MITHLLALASLAADPARLDLTLPMPRAAEPGPYGWSDQPTLLVLGGPAPTGTPDDPGTTVDAGRLSISCRTRKGAMELAVRWVPAAYPEHLPRELVCGAGGITAHVRLEPIRALYTAPTELAADESRGADVRRYRTDRGDLAQGNVTFALPSDVRWIDADGVATRDDALWTGVSCSIRGGERPTLTVRTTEVAHDGSGSCAVADREGGTRLIPMRVRSVRP